MQENKDGVIPYNIKEAPFDTRYINIIDTYLSTNIGYFLEDLGEGHPYRFASLTSGRILLMQKEDEEIKQYEDTRVDLVLPYNCFRFAVVTAKDNALTREYQTFALHKDSFKGVIERANYIYSTNFIGGIAFTISGNTLMWFDTLKPKSDLNAARLKQADSLYGTPNHQ